MGRKSEKTRKGSHRKRVHEHIYPDGPLTSITHMFSLDSDRNQDPPTWFFDIGDASRENSDSRQTAEQILMMGRRYGNVLMRTSTSFGASGKYVISMRREVAGGTKLDHYEVIKTAQGFKINVDNRHSAMHCLNDVMDFFITVAGHGTVPMTTNDIDKIFGHDTSVPPAPSLSSGGNSWNTMAPSSGRRDSSHDEWSSHTTRPTSTSGKLGITGNISGDMVGAIRDINYGTIPSPPAAPSLHNMHQPLHETSPLPVSSPPPPPPLPQEPTADYPQQDYINIGTTSNSYDGGHGGGNTLNQHIDRMNLHQGDIPVPPPMMPPGGPPMAPPLPPANQGFGGDGGLHTLSPTPRPSARPSQSSMIGGGGGGGIMDDSNFWDKLRKRKEDIYADPTAVLTNH